MAARAAVARLTGPRDVALPLPRRAGCDASPARRPHGPPWRARDAARLVARATRSGTMTLVASRDELLARRAVAAGPLSPLAQGLRAELQPLIEGNYAIPEGKAALSRAGGRCAVDGTLLEYDPYSPGHRCPRCGRTYEGDLHDRFRLYWHHLWLAERAVHGAL